MNWPALNSAQKRFALLAGAGTLVAFFLGNWLVNTVGTRYHLAFDATNVTCLPWRVFVLDGQKIDLKAIRRGDLLQFVARNAKPLPDGFKVTKFVAGLPGDKIVVKANQFYINGEHFGSLPHLLMLRKPSGYFDREFVVPEGQYMMIGTELESYDSRYWGPIHDDQILGRAYIVG